MTALRKYQRLESSGLWRETPEARLQEVLVALRSTTLILADPKTEIPLTQWSLPALRRLNPAQLPAVYAVADDKGETLEIEDRDMILALETVKDTLERRRPQTGRLRGSLLGGTAAVLLALALFWLPGSLIDYTANMLPLTTRAQFGQLALADLRRLTGSACTSPLGSAALERMARRIDPISPPMIRILREGLGRPASLPGDLVLLPERMLAQSDGADAIAGMVIAERRRVVGREPTKALLHYAGLWATLRLLTSGSMAPQSLAGYGEIFLQTEPAALTDEDLISAFKTAAITTRPYEDLLNAAVKAEPHLADPMPNGSDPVVLEDGVWLGLQAICQ